MNPKLIAFSAQPAHVEAVQKLNDINAARTRAHARLQEIELELARRRTTPSSPLAMADRILADPEFAGAHSNADSLRAEHLRMREHAEILSEAQAHQSLQLHAIFQETSRAATAVIAADHKALAGRMAKKLRELDALQAEEVAMFRSVEALGYAVGAQLERVSWPLIGTLATLPDQSALSRRIVELERYADTPPHR